MGPLPPRSAFPTAVGKVSAIVLGKWWGTGGERGTTGRKEMGRKSDCSLRNLNQTGSSPSYGLTTSTIRGVWQEVSLMERTVSCPSPHPNPQVSS